MAGDPRDWFATGEPTRDHDPTEVDDAGATGRFDLGRRKTAPGTIGRYQLEALLGEGAMGMVWRARDPQLDRDVAIKVVHPAIAASPEASTRLRREARAMAKLSHPNVVTVHDAGEEGGRLFVAMELVDGDTLGERLRALPRRDWRPILTWFLAAGRGLAAAHAAGVLHRDFKPDNVLVDRSGRARVADFGLAVLGGPVEPTRAVSHGPARTDRDLTAAGAVLGTPAYMSPEQLRGAELDGRADQFSFCVALYEALYQRHPFLVDERMTIAALVDAIDRGAIAQVPARDAVPRWLRAAIVRGLAAEPSQRWASLDELLTALTPPPSPAPRWLIGALSLAVAAVVVAIVALATGGARHRPPGLTSTATPIRRFEVSLAARIALSPDGARLAIATPDRIDVRDLDGGGTWSHLEPSGLITRVEFADRDHLLLARHKPFRLAELDLATGAVRELWTEPEGRAWLGRLDGVDLVAYNVDGRTVVRRRGDDGPPVLDNPEPLMVVATSPRGDRLAVVGERRYHGQLVVADGRAAPLRSDWIAALTAVAWLDDDTLVYATGTIEAPTLWRVEVGRTKLGPPTRWFGAARGWFGQLAVGGDRVLFVDSGAAFRSRIVDRGAAQHRVRDLDASSIGAVLAWLDDGTFVVWNRGTGGLERHGGAGPIAATKARLDGEIVNATRSGDVVIAALRRDAGRELVAVALSDGRELWRRPPGWGRAVRCAGDRQAPCAMIDDVEGEQTVRWIDPDTGALGAALVTWPRIDDIALSNAGDSAMFTDGGYRLVRRELETGVDTSVVIQLSPRAIAFDPRGGMLVTGTRSTNEYQLVQVDPVEGVSQLLQSRDEILFLPRAAPDGGAVSVMGRLFLPVVYELPR